MNRRELIKAIAPAALVPFIVKGKEIGKAIQIDPSAKYMVFVDGYMLDAMAMAQHPTCPLPEGTPIYSVKVFGDKSIDEAIRIFKLP